MNHNFNTSQQNHVAKRQFTWKKHHTEKEKAQFQFYSTWDLTYKSQFLIYKLTG